MGKRSYKRSTPIGRLRRNVEKIVMHAVLSQARLKSWQNGVPDPRMTSAWKILQRMIYKAGQVDAILESLEESGWQSSKKTSIIHFEVGQHVAIAPGSRQKYELVFGKSLKKDPGLMDDLIVETVLPSGGISVRRKHGTPCLIPAKSHLILVEK